MSDMYHGIMSRCWQGWVLLEILGRVHALPIPASGTICIPWLVAISLQSLLLWSHHFLLLLLLISYLSRVRVLVITTGPPGSLKITAPL